MTEFECILDEPIDSAWPVASDWLETFLHDGGNRWDHRIASVMTAAAVTAALAHTNRPVRLVGATTGATAQISLQAHSTGQPQEWTALSPIVEDALPRLRRHTRHCGAEVRLSMAGAETSLWFRLPRPATGIRRLRRQPSASATSSLIPCRRVDAGRVDAGRPRAHVAAQAGTRLSVAGGTAVCTSRSSVCPTKSASRPADRRGSSRCGKWPALGKICSRLFGMARCGCRACRTGIRRSRPPHTIMVGISAMTGSLSAALDHLAARVDHGAQGGEEGAPGADVTEAGVAPPQLLLLSGGFVGAPC